MTRRLLFVSHSFPPDGRPHANVGGMQRVATELFEAFGHVDGLELSGHLLRTSWRMTHARIPFFLWRVQRHLAREARERSVDVVLFSSMVTASVATRVQPALRQAGIRTAAIVHGQDVTTPFGPYQRFVPKVFDALDAVLPVSRATGAQCTDRGLPPAKLHVVPNGVKLARFAPLEPRPVMRRELVQAIGDPAHPFPENALLLCSVGRHVKRKGFAWFVEHVMTQLPADVHLWLAGEGPETPLIQAAAQRFGVEDRVRVLGRVSDADLMRLYRGADLFVMPNIPIPGTMEGFGVVMLEAGISGLPAIASRLEGIQDVIAEGENGHFVETGDAAGFVRTILRYDRDRTALAQAADRAAAYTRQTFSWEAVARRYLEIVQSL